MPTADAHSPALRLDARGIWVPWGMWTLTDAPTTPTHFARADADPGAPHDIGVLVDLDIAQIFAGGSLLS